jgi:hypothetical protein
MTPSTRSSVKIQQTAAGEWRVIEGRESRRLTAEEMNDFVVQNSSMKQELDRAMMQAKEKESMLEELGAELEELRTMRQWEEPNADESQERKLDAESVEDAVEQKLAPFTELLTQLTRRVEQLSLRDGGIDDNDRGKSRRQGPVPQAVTPGLEGQMTVQARGTQTDGRYEDRRSQQTVQGQPIGCHGIQNRRRQFRVCTCVLGPPDRTISRGSNTLADTGGACVSGSGGYCIPANCSGEHERKRADVVGLDARKVV